MSMTAKKESSNTSTITPTSQGDLKVDTEASGDRGSNGISANAKSKTKLDPLSTNHGLSWGETLLASLFLVMWLFLFGGGITMDTTKFRCAVSASGASALATEALPGDEAAKNVCQKAENASWVPIWSSSLSTEGARTYRLLVAWAGILFFFLPLNLAMVSAAAGALGAFGNKANLEHDRTKPVTEALPGPSRSVDVSSPILSGLLRGLFVYLFFISGLLLFDDKPFSSPGPGQYIRLAGFISLISFLVNYRPHLFTTISDWAFERINSRKVIPTPPDEDEVKIEKTKETNEKTTLKIQMPANGEADEKALPERADTTPNK